MAAAAAMARPSVDRNLRNILLTFDMIVRAQGFAVVVLLLLPIPRKK